MELFTFENIKIILTISFILISFPIIKAMLGAPFVPTPRNTMKKMFSQINIKPKQVVYDLGCGDGRFVREASRKYQAKAIGIELNPVLFLYSKIKSWNKKNETILCKDLKTINLSNADFVICYLLPKTMAKIENKLNQELKKGTLLVSHGFKFKNWKPLKMLEPSKNEYGRIYVFEKKS